MKLNLKVFLIFLLKVQHLINAQNNNDNQISDNLQRSISLYEEKIARNQNRLIELQNQIELELRNIDFNNVSKVDDNNNKHQLDECHNNLHNLLAQVTEQQSYITKYREQQKYLPTNCLKWDETNVEMWKIQLIKVGDAEPLPVQCTANYAQYGMPWMLMQMRYKDGKGFNRSWTEYSEGFGHLGGEYFIGLQTLHLLTTSRPHELLILLKDAQRGIRKAHYNHFVIGSEEEGYALRSLGAYSGDAGNFFHYNLHMKFSTYDRDNDEAAINCAANYQAWWHKACTYCNLNGKSAVWDNYQLIDEVQVLIRAKYT